jgi:hypothetical protein
VRHAVLPGEDDRRPDPDRRGSPGIRKSPHGGQCHLDNDIGQRAKKTDYQKKVVSFSLPEKGKHSRHTKQNDAFICEKNVYNKIVRLLCRGSLLPTGI